MWKLVALKLRFSEVMQALSYLSQKIHLILALKTVVLTALYVHWGTRSRTCRVFVYMLLREKPWEYRAVLYIVEKSFQRDHNAAGIVRNGSVFTEKLREQDNKYGP